MEMVKLVNGSEEAEVLVKTAMFAIHAIPVSLQGATMVYDLIECARNRSYRPFGGNGKALVDLGLLQNEQGVMHESIRNIVLSATRGEGIDAYLGDPRLNTQG